MSRGQNAKLSDIINQFDGMQDFSEWIKKFELVMQLQNQKNYQKILPLFLSGEAFNVYDSLSENDKESYSCLKDELKKAFTPDSFTMYEDFTRRKLNLGESVDNFLSHLKKMAYSISEETPEIFIKCAFVNGLPLEVKNQLKACCSLEELNLSQIIGKARMLIRNAAVTTKKSNPAEKYVQPYVKCTECGENHLRKFCPLLKGKCFRCRGEHFLKNCPEKYSKNE